MIIGHKISKIQDRQYDTPNRKFKSEMCPYTLSQKRHMNDHNEGVKKKILTTGVKFVEKVLEGRVPHLSIKWEENASHAKFAGVHHQLQVI